jgi:hypothetical protein
MNGRRQTSFERAVRRHKVLSAVVVLVSLLGVVLFLVVRSFLASGGKTHELSLDEIIGRYNASTSVSPSTSTSTSVASSTGTPSTPATSAPVPSVLPAPGVYVYATTGSDSIDVVGGVHHDYPGTTTITVTPRECGVVERWDVVAERWEERQHCVVGAGVAEPGRVNYDEFFNIGQKQTCVCTGDARPLEGAAGTTWTRTCHMDNRDDIYTGTVVGVEQLTVGETTVPALHVRVTVDNGRRSDSQTSDSWYRLGTDLLLAQSTSNRTTNDTTFGVVHYTEDYELHLTSLVPLG